MLHNAVGEAEGTASVVPDEHSLQKAACKGLLETTAKGERPLACARCVGDQFFWVRVYGMHVHADAAVVPFSLCSVVASHRQSGLRRRLCQELALGAAGGQ